ncbi:MAG: hypothetical protein JSV03_16535 [Planctomycetota bacterium]|nr:MAG: hypothetical protein JSV03_16535 [Planctomycetota bacterium]
MWLSAEDIPVKAIMKAARRSDLISVIQKLYAEIDSRIAEQKATCRACGKCCHFANFEHRLYVTALEAVYYLAQGNSPPSVAADTCPHLIDGKCDARVRRPFACRIFYCDPEHHDWQGPLSEEYNARLRTLHTEFNIPYIYTDWMILLRALSPNQQKPNKDRLK